LPCELAGHDLRAVVSGPNPGRPSGVLRHLDCYFSHGSGPTSNPDGDCGVNKVNPPKGMAPKTVADQVYLCLACPGTSLVSSCAGVPDTAPCTDNNACTKGDMCIGGACVPGPQTPCPGDQCNNGGTCNPTTGACSKTPKADGTTCDDGNACTKTDMCQSGVCGGTAYACDDGLDCTADSCNGDGTCTHSPVANSCVIDGVCYANMVTNPGNQCQICDPAQPSTWKNNADGTSCSDGNSCTKGDSCQSGACSGTAYVCDDGLDCTTDSCNGDGTCTNTVSMPVGERRLRSTAYNHRPAAGARDVPRDSPTQLLGSGHGRGDWLGSESYWTPDARLRPSVFLPAVRAFDIA
jgi:hypothetical protein